MTLGVGYAVGRNVVVETVFSWPGIGRMLVRAVSSHARWRRARSCCCGRHRGYEFRC